MRGWLLPDSTRDHTLPASCDPLYKNSTKFQHLRCNFGVRFYISERFRPWKEITRYGYIWPTRTCVTRYGAASCPASFFPIFLKKLSFGTYRWGQGVCILCGFLWDWWGEIFACPAERQIQSNRKGNSRWIFLQIRQRLTTPQANSLALAENVVSLFSRDIRAHCWEWFDYPTRCCTEQHINTSQYFLSHNNNVTVCTFYMYSVSHTNQSRRYVFDVLCSFLYRFLTRCPGCSASITLVERPGAWSASGVDHHIVDAQITNTGTCTVSFSFFPLLLISSLLLVSCPFVPISSISLILRLLLVFLIS